MALRDVVIKLRLDSSQFKTAIAGAARDTRAFTTATATGAAGAGKSLGLLRGSYATVGLAAGLAGVAAVRAAADFEQGMANVNATGAASESQMHDLRDAALEMGRTSVYSSTEAAGGMEALLKAGLSAKDVIGGGLKGSFNLAAAGELEVAEAAETAASAMAQFSLSGKDVPHIADLLAAGAGKANGDVRDLGQALNQAGLIAAGAGASIEETTGTLAAFAKAGLLGSDAGTSFKTMLQRLQHPVGDAALLLDKYNISAYDAKGNFVGLASVAGQLQTAFKGLTQEQRSTAMAVIFGSDSVRAANVLYKEGRSGINDWTDRVNDAGYAADVAAKKTDTLKGDLDKMKNSWRALAEGSGGDGHGGLRPLIQGLDDVADSIGKVDRALDRANEKLFGDRGAHEGEGPFAQIKTLIDMQKAKNLGVQPEVFVKFKTEGAADAIKTAAQVANAQGMSDRTVRSVLELIGWSPEGIDTVISRMDAIDKRTVTSQLQLMGYETDEIDAVNDGLDETDSKHPTPRLDIENLTPSQRKLADLYGLLKDVDKTHAHPSITLETAEAMGKISRLQRAIDTFRNSGHEVGFGTVLERASGGPIFGRGTETSDDIPIRASNNEHMWSAREVRAAGGHGAVYRLRAAALAGALPGFANGGAVVRGYAAGGAARSGASSVHTQVGISILDVSFDANRSMASMRVVATDAARNVLADQVFEADI